MIRTVVVDDEPLAREGICAHLELERDIEVVGQAVDGPDAVDVILSLRPALLFLDVQMPGLDGFEVLQRIAPEHLPVTIFVTAYDAYAIRAFDAHALDYLLKPIDATRFRTALARARDALDQLETLHLHRRIMGLLGARGIDAVGEGGQPVARAGRLVVRDGDRYLLLGSDEIDWIEAAGNYLRIHARGAVFTMRATLTSMEQQLDPHSFTRIHRGTIVNIARIAEIRPEWHGDHEVVLHDGSTLRLSRTYRQNLLP